MAYRLSLRPYSMLIVVGKLVNLRDLTLSTRRTCVIIDDKCYFKHHTLNLNAIVLMAFHR